MAKGGARLLGASFQTPSGYTLDGREVLASINEKALPQGMEYGLQGKIELS